MKEQLLDLKLKRLIQLCKETQNYKKLAVVSFVLTSNTIDEIGIKLGMRPREKNAGEKIFEYMELVNKIFSLNFKINIFKPEVIEIFSQIELLFLKKEGDLGLDHIREVFDIYYELRKLEIPNLHENINSDILDRNRSISMFSFLSGGQNSRNKREGAFNPILLHKFREEEKALQIQLEKGFDKETFEKILHLKTIRKNIEQGSRGKIIISGSLKDNISYRQSKENSGQFLIFGLIILFAMIGIVTVIESFMFGVLSEVISYNMLICFGAIIVLYFINKTYFGKR
ncbi:MAG: hypothetical protein KGD61_05740 [Candidatus Lokiarchaeota archaeon]|nr:hypothetical protein [Candidatus Lokiarchaeota archaeon]